MQLEQLIKILTEERPGDQQEEVEFIIVTKKGRIIAMDVESQAKAIIKALKLFGSA